MLHILQAIVDAGGSPLFVGGCVRDKVMGNEPKDLDVEVYGMAGGELVSVLEKFGKVDNVGASFGVIKLRASGKDYDFSLPRTENKQGKGHKGFIVELSANLTVKEAAARRDFTINSMAMNPFTSEVIDPYGGLSDIGNCLLEPTSEAFKEDSLRVLRGMQFAGRFQFKPTDNCIKQCNEIYDDYKDLAKERVWGEWEKWALKSTIPSYGLDFLYDVDWLGHYPELLNLVGCQQDAIWHPEGDAFIHTGHVVDAAMDIAEREKLEGDDKLVLIFAALTHDFGKPSTTQMRDVRGVQRWTSWGHEEAGVPLSRSFLESIGCPERIIERVLPLVQYHLAHVIKEGLSRRYVRRLSIKLGKATLRELDMLIEADMSGRPPLPAGKHPQSQLMLEIANQEPDPILTNGVKPLVMGRHLIGLGIQPGPLMGELLKQLFELQLDGSFETLEDGLTLAKSMVQ